MKDYNHQEQPSLYKLVTEMHTIENNVLHMYGKIQRLNPVVIMNPDTAEIRVEEADKSMKGCGHTFDKPAFEPDLDNQIKGTLAGFPIHYLPFLPIPNVWVVPWGFVETIRLIYARKMDVEKRQIYEHVLCEILQSIHLKLCDPHITYYAFKDASFRAICRITAAAPVRIKTYAEFKKDKEAS